MHLSPSRTMKIQTDSMITTFNKAVTVTASGKRRQRERERTKTAEVPDLCDKRREMRKKRFEPEGSEKYKKVNNNIKRYTKKANENWIGEQWIETEKYLRKNNNKKAYHLVKDLKPVWNDKSISLSSKIQRMRSLVTTISNTLVNHGPAQQSSDEEYKPWK